MDTNQVRICVSVCERSLAELEQSIARAAKAGTTIELRLDCLDDSGFEQLGRIANLIATLEREVIITFRPGEQGGHREADHATREKFWNTRGPLFKESLLDIELDLAEGFIRSAAAFPDWKNVICSHHDFKGIPADLEQIYERMIRTGAALLKIAFQANDVTDCIPVFHLLDRAGKNGRQLIAIAMGLAGVATRILGPFRGAYLTYGSLDTGRSTGPGQPTADELRDLYRVGRINFNTEITGLMGLPVTHSFSPHIHNAAFAVAKINAVFIPFEVHDVAAFMKRMVRPTTREIEWHLRGLSVTAPHKTAVIDHLDWIEPSASEIGAVNTIVVGDGKLRGYNTDATTILRPVIERLGPLRDTECAIIGAGGVASAALWSLKREGANTTLFARDSRKGSALAEKFGAQYQPLDGASFEGFDLVINATPLGTRGVLETESPTNAVQLRGARLAYDLVYNPSETRFLSQARAAGCDTIGGLEMLVLQAAEQFRLWTGVEAPTSVMHEAANRAVSQQSQIEK